MAKNGSHFEKRMTEFGRDYIKNRPQEPSPAEVQAAERECSEQGLILDIDQRWSIWRVYDRDTQTLIATWSWRDRLATLQPGDRRVRATDWNHLMSHIFED